MTSSAPSSNSDTSKNTRPVALIAGGAGFLGSHLAETLLSQNFQVIIVDNLSSGKRENIKDILTSPNLTFIEADINTAVFELPENVKIDYCFHFASTEAYRSKKDLSLDTLLVNSLGTRQILEVARAKGAKFILLSDADLYTGAISSSSLRYYFGRSSQGETILSAHEAKRFAEALAFEYYRKFDLPLSIIRVKDVYGPKMNLDRGDEMADLLKAGLEKETLKISGDGLKVLNPTFVSDVIFGVVKASLGDFSGEIFILVNPEKVTVESFAKTVALLAGPVEIEHKKQTDSFEMPFSHFDLENTKEKIGWNPKVTLTEGVSSVIQNYNILFAKESPEEPRAFGEDKMQEASAEESLPRIEEKETAPVAKPKRFPFVRWIVFLVSLLLLIVTIVYPAVALGINSSNGRKSLTEAASAFDKENNDLAQTKALSAQNTFVTATEHLQSISWLLKIIGFSNSVASYDRALGADGALAQALRNSAAANQILIITANTNNLTPENARSKLNEALNRLYSSRDKIEEATLGLEAVDWNKIPGSFLPDKNFVTAETNNLQKQVDQLIVAIEKSLSKSSR